MITSPLRQYFRIRKVVVDGEPDARRVEMHVGVQTSVDRTGLCGGSGARGVLHHCHDPND